MRHDPLREAAGARSAGAVDRAHGALIELQGLGETVTFAGVAARGEVSRQFLYSHAELRAKIEGLRGERHSPVRLPAHERAGEASTRTRLRGALDENKRLRDEIADLRCELALAHGRVRELTLDRGTTGAA